MIKVTIYIDQQNRIERYNITGHAGYDVEGKDIVCAAVSMLGQTTLLALVKVCNIGEEKIGYLMDDKKGILDVKIPTELDKDTRNKVETVFRTFEVGIQSIVENYPEYVTLKYREV